MDYTNNDDDDQLSSVIAKMLGDTEKETDKSMFPPKAPADAGHSVTITINHAPLAKSDKDADAEFDDGGYGSLMEGLKKNGE